jgi:hypothetical protein
LLDLLAVQALILLVGILMPLAIGLTILLLSKNILHQHASEGLPINRQQTAQMNKEEL